MEDKKKEKKERRNIIIFLSNEERMNDRYPSFVITSPLTRALNCPRFPLVTVAIIPNLSRKPFRFSSRKVKRGN